MRLLFPFYIVSILWAIPAEIFIQGGSWTVIVKNFILAISPAQLWFLPMLFWIYLVFYFFSDFIERVPIHTIICYFIYWEAVFEQIRSLEYFSNICIDRIFAVLLYGIPFSKSNVAKNSRMKDCAVLISAFILEVIFFCFGFNRKCLILIFGFTSCFVFLY